MSFSGKKKAEKKYIYKNEKKCDRINKLIKIIKKKNIKKNK